MPAILAVARSHGLRVIEDCAQAHGASVDGRSVGTWGDLAGFSFYPTKNLGAFGDGGAVVTNDSRLEDKVRALREYGWKKRFISETPGLNSRLDELHAATLRVLLKHVLAENARRRDLAACYARSLAATELALPQTRDAAVHVFHQYVVKTRRREALQRFLAKRGIPTQVHYPVPIHQQPAYRGRLWISRAGLPNTERAAKTVLSLPISPHLTRRYVAQVCSAVRDHGSLLQKK
jgi:dTDP-4-amino-4,6-dideoxygalactose transaminase